MVGNKLVFALKHNDNITIGYFIGILYQKL